MQAPSLGCRHDVSPERRCLEGIACLPELQPPAPSNNPVTCMLSCLLQGRTPLDRARQYDQQEAVEVLLAHQGKAS